MRPIALWSRTLVSATGRARTRGNPAAPNRRSPELESMHPSGSGGGEERDLPRRRQAFGAGAVMEERRLQGFGTAGTTEEVGRGGLERVTAASCGDFRSTVGISRVCFHFPARWSRRMKYATRDSAICSALIFFYSGRYFAACAGALIPASHAQKRRFLACGGVLVHMLEMLL